MKVSFDTNILVYCLDSDDPDRHTRSLALLDTAIGADVLLSLQALSEMPNVARRVGRRQEALRLLGYLRRNFPIINADIGCLEEAVAITDQHRFSFWDAMLVATVRRAGCEILFTEDMQDGRSIGGLLLVNPFEEDNAGLVDFALKRNG